MAPALLVGQHCRLEMLHRVLLIDDSEGEVLLVRSMLKDAGFSEPIYWVQSSSAAMAYLCGEGFYSDRLRFPLPEIILLDLGMPEMDGYDLLRWIRQRPHLSHTIVVILTGEMDPQRIRVAYQLGANSYLCKSAGLEEFKVFVEFLHSYGVIANTLPPQVAPSPPARPKIVPDPPASETPGEKAG